MSSPSLSSSGLAVDVRERLNLDPAQWGVQALAEIGVAVALAAVLGQLRLFMMPQGGSVSLEALPIIFVAVRRGVVPGATAGLLYGLLQLVLPGAFVFQPLQAALDYPLAFMALGAAGFVDVRGWRTLAVAVFVGAVEEHDGERRPRRMPRLGACGRGVHGCAVRPRPGKAAS